MAVFVVGIQNVTRESAVQTTTDGGTFSSIGGGVNVVTDTDISYQGGASVTSKVSNKTDSGHQFVRTTTQNVPNRVWLLKIINTNNGAISGNGIRCALGNDNSNMYEWQVVPTAADYSDALRLGMNVQGWWLFAIDENSTINRTQTGSPAFATWDYYHNIITNNATAKAENLGTDAIDHCSATDGGLLLNGGDTGPAGAFADFVAFDGNTAANRYGLAIEYQGKSFGLGTVRIGDATLTEFTSAGESYTWTNSRTPAGFNRLHIDLQTTGTVVSITRGSLDSVGEAVWLVGAISTDTRVDLFVEATTGTLALVDTSFTNFRNVTLTSAATVTGCTLDLYDITMSTATVSDTTITTTAIDGTAACNDLSFGDQTAISWAKGSRTPTTTDPGTGHAIEVTTTGAKSATSLSFADYPAVSTFDTITGINAGTDVLTTDAVHGLVDGERVYLNANGGTDTVGLTAHTTAYFVNVPTTTTMTLHTTLALGIAGTSPVNLSVGATGEVQWLEPGSAAVYNSSGGAVTWNVTGGSSPSVRNSAGSTTTVVSSVPVQVVVLDKNNDPIGTAQTSMFLTADNSEVLNLDTNGSGVASGSFAGATPAAVYWRVRKASPGDTKYTTRSGVGTIEATTGLSITVTLLENPNNNA